MAKHFLLLGAGFSRNWGGWLASEAFEYLLGTEEVRINPNLRDRLWKYQKRGGFEGALAELQVAAERDDKNRGATARELRSFDSALRKMFADMNSAFIGSSDPLIDDQTKEFLARFDAIFTLNQDLLLERHYLFGGQFPRSSGSSKWARGHLPGVEPAADFYPNVLDRANWQQAKWIVRDCPLDLNATLQPVFKLHGSSHWYLDQTNTDLMVMGGGKIGSIEKVPLLRSYLTQFGMLIGDRAARLMVLGYGFGDNHINDLISSACDSGTKVFVIDPSGADVWVEGRDADGIGTNRLQSSLIGASRRPIAELLKSGTPEHSKMMRFFEGRA